MVRTIYLSFFLTDNERDTICICRLWKTTLEIFTITYFFAKFKINAVICPYIRSQEQFIVSLFLAVIANEKLKGIGFFRTIFSSTMGISVAAASVFWMFLFHPTMGWLNQILQALGSIRLVG